jgi:predicted nucleotidyltransferase
MNGLRIMKIPSFLPALELTAFCRKWRIREMALFGSALRDDFRPDSDIDFLVSFEKGVNHSLGDLVKAEDELSRIIGRKADLVERPGIEHSHNALRRDAILNTAQIIYAE